MKIGIFADVHGNLSALEAVLAALQAAGCGKLLCLGDVVGYGPQPQACVDRLRALAIPCVLGNHDEWAANDAVVVGAPERLVHSLSWTRQALTAESRAWLAALPWELDYAGLHLVHASHGSQGGWPYIKDVRSLTFNFAHQTAALAFNGHTHVPAVGQQPAEGPPAFLPLAPSMILPAQCKLLINPGSVGQPRDRDPRAAALYYDTRERSITFVRAAYDIAAVQAAMQAAGLPQHHAERLSKGE